MHRTITRLKRSIMRMLPLICTVLLLAGGPAAAAASTLEHPYLYKSTRAMGMGGAYTAVGGRVDTLFYNPAGLTNIPQDKGWEVNLVHLSAEVGKNTLDFADDLDAALTTGDLNSNGSATDDQVLAVNDLLLANQGRNMHLRAANLTSIGRSYDSFAFGLGAFASGRLDATPRLDAGPLAELEISADATWGVVTGFSLPLGDGLYAGASLKALHRESLAHIFTADDLVNNQEDLDGYITNELRREGDALGWDAGLLWKFAVNSWWRPAAGVSVMNIGDLDFGGAGTIPMTVNAGVSVNPRIPVFRSLLLGADLVDITKEFEQDRDLAKRLRYGAELQLFDRMLLELALRAGMYQGYPTFGAELRTLILSVSYAMYGEEIGASAGQDRDQRHLLTLNLGW